MTAQWTDKALQRLQQIHDHIASDSPVNAEHFVDRLTNKAALIATQPHAGVVVKKYQRDEIREVYEGQYRIIYQIREQRIEILTVRHGARLLPKHSRNL